MKRVDKSIRICAFAVAAILVTGTTYALGSLSDAKFAAALASAGTQTAATPARTATATTRVDVIGKRTSRTAA